MTIPSPRKFLETVAVIVVAACCLAGMVFAVFLLAAFAMVEALVDRLRPSRRRP